MESKEINEKKYKLLYEITDRLEKVQLDKWNYTTDGLLQKGGITKLGQTDVQIIYHDANCYGGLMKAEVIIFDGKEKTSLWGGRLYDDKVTGRIKKIVDKLEKKSNEENRKTEKTKEQIKLTETMSQLNNLELILADD